jgi:hypothetical protein
MTENPIRCEKPDAPFSRLKESLELLDGFFPAEGRRVTP